VSFTNVTPIIDPAVTSKQFTLEPAAVVAASLTTAAKQACASRKLGF
jgi:hypothetical protein